jgi:hypothetical protein
VGFDSHPYQEVGRKNDLALGDKSTTVNRLSITPMNLSSGLMLKKKSSATKDRPSLLPSLQVPLKRRQVN